MAKGWYEEPIRHQEAAIKGLERKGAYIAPSEREENLERHSYHHPKRAEIVKQFMVEGDEIDQKIFTEIRGYKPLGVMGEIAVAMGVNPRKGVRIDVPFGPYVFSEKRAPSRETVARWFALHKEAERKREQAAEYAFGLGARPNTITGNFRVVEHARRLLAQGLLTPEEEKILSALETFWREHPELDKQKGNAVWGRHLQLTPLE